MLLVVGLACILVVVGCGDGDGSPTVTVTPKSARDLPTATPVPTADRGEPSRSFWSIDPDGRDCSGFATWSEANEFFRAAGGPQRDPYRLDPDADGVPCEALREQKPDG